MALIISSLVPLLYLCLALPDWITYLVNFNAKGDASYDEVMYMFAFICAIVRSICMKFHVLKLGNLLYTMENIDVPRVKPKLKVNADIAKSQKILNRIVAFTIPLGGIGVLLTAVRWYVKKEHSNHLPSHLPFAVLNMLLLTVYLYAC
ncbi:uncharacterized protein LOC116176243 [Photinus pyralis]|uniref:uncharacterized protein LOC116176243 n=1 Tax=Photinus pyralis TaxID=7054 RepID=UPI0012671C65|nr:uncharacterized protein LOC116176243 [Photinus pyralis]